MRFSLAVECSAISSWSLSEIASLERLAGACFRGLHLLTIESPKVAVCLLEQPKGTFSSPAISIFKKSLSNYTFQGGLDTLKLVSIVIAPDAAVPSVLTRHKRVVSFSAMHSLSFESTTLLAENIVDAKIFEISGRHFLADRRIKGLTLAAVPRGGGGSTIVPELQEIVQQRKQVCLAFTDSDHSFPGCGPSSTSSKCAKLTNGCAIVEHQELSVREVENLVPTNLLQEFADSIEIGAAVDCYIRILKVDLNIKRFVDIKDGLSGLAYFKLSGECAQRLYLDGILDSNSRLQRRCKDREQCEFPGGRCHCAVIPRVGQVGTKFHEWLSERSNHKALESISGHWREYWLDIGETVLAWCCAQPATIG